MMTWSSCSIRLQAASMIMIIRDLCFDLEVSLTCSPGLFLIFVMLAQGITSFRWIQVVSIPWKRRLASLDSGMAEMGNFIILLLFIYILFSLCINGTKVEMWGIEGNRNSHRSEAGGFSYQLREGQSFQGSFIDSECLPLNFFMSRCNIPTQDNHLLFAITMEYGNHVMLFQAT